MISKVQKWGNSLAVRIPRGFARDTGLEEGAQVDMKIEAGEIRIRPIRRPRYRLDELVAAITPENVHGEVDYGPGVGGEAW